MQEFVIDCSACEHGEDHDDDCVVSYLLDRSDGAVVFDAAEERALRELAKGGLIPPTRLKRKTG